MCERVCVDRSDCGVTNNHLYCVQELFIKRVFYIMDHLLFIDVYGFNIFLLKQIHSSSFSNSFFIQ